MSWAGIANNQTISYNNLQDAVNNGIFTLNLAIAATEQQCTKDYVSTHVSGFNPNYPSYAAKSSSQLVVKSDLYNPGNFTLSPQYGMYFTGLTCTGAPSFTFNVTTQTTLPFNTTIPAQTITVNLNGSSFVGYPLNVSLILNSVTVLDCATITGGGAQSKTLTLPNDITGPSTLRISIGSGACAVTPPSVTFTNISIGATAINPTGQYQYAAGTKFLYSAAEQGYMYVSSDYGATWTQKTSVYDYFMGMAVSDDGQRVMAVGFPGSFYLSTNAGNTWTKLTSFPNITDGFGDTYSPTVMCFSNVSMSGDGLTVLASFLTSKFTKVSDPTQVAYISGVYKSTNGGSSWTTLAYSTNGAQLSANAMNSSGTNQIYSFDGGFRYSTNSGGSFAASGTNQQYLDIGEISMRNNGTEIYAVARAMTGFQDSYPVKSTDGGATWTNITAGSSGTYGSWSSIAASDNGLIIALKNSFYGNGWYPTTIVGNVYNDITSLPPTDLYQTCSVSRSAGYGLIGSTTGLYKTSNGGSTWVSI
jgi:photosystem II stability/assembly factor-like uncharacterized protein